MKKYLPYILIITIITGFLSPKNVEAADGFCFNSNGTQLIQGKTNTQECAKITGGILITTAPTCNLAMQFATIGICQYVASQFEAASAQATVKNTGPYKLLAPLPGADGKMLTEIPVQNGLGMYLNIIIKMFIGIAAVLSIVMMVVGGLEYMTSELSHSKEAGKEKIMQAIIGLIIAIGAYALLFTINPDLLKSDPSIPTTTVKITQTGTGTAGYCSISMINNESDCKSATPPGTWTTSAGLIPGIVPNLTGIGSCSISMINNEADCKSATPPGVWTP